MQRVHISLAPIPPYEFDLTASYATYFLGHYGVESYLEGVFRRLLEVNTSPCLVSVRSRGTVDFPLLEVELQSPAPDEATIREVQRCVSGILGTEQDLAPFYRMACEEPPLSPLVLGLRGLHIPQTAGVYEALVLAILGQQLSMHVARVMRTQLIQTFGRSVNEGGRTYHAFPAPATLAGAGVERLRSLGISAPKASYIVEISSRVESKELDLETLRSRPDEEVVQTLTAIRGIGEWTAQWILVRGLGRPDGFPHGDLALRRAMGALLNRSGPLSVEEALARSRVWSPFRSYVTTYLFAAALSGRFPQLVSRGKVGP